MATIGKLELPQGAAANYVYAGGENPGLIYLPGLYGQKNVTDSTGGHKASFLSHYCGAQNREFTALQWQTPGDGPISAWRRNLFDSFVELNERHYQGRPQMLVASSMGAHMAALLIHDLAGVGMSERISGAVFFAPGFDALWQIATKIKTYSPKEFAAMKTGVLKIELRPSHFHLSYAHIEDGLINPETRHGLLIGSNPIIPQLPENIPASFVHGTKDPVIDVNVTHAALYNWPSSWKSKTILDGAGHDLNDENGLVALRRAIEGTFSMRQSMAARSLHPALARTR